MICLDGEDQILGRNEYSSMDSLSVGRWLEQFCPDPNAGSIDGNKKRIALSLMWIHM
jgi:hypothetical protein